MSDINDILNEQIADDCQRRIDAAVAAEQREETAKNAAKVLIHENGELHRRLSDIEKREERLRKALWDAETLLRLDADVRSAILAIQAALVDGAPSSNPDWEIRPDGWSTNGGKF